MQVPTACARCDQVYDIPIQSIVFVIRESLEKLHLSQTRVLIVKKKRRDQKMKRCDFLKKSLTESNYKRVPLT